MSVSSPLRVRATAIGLGALALVTTAVAAAPGGQAAAPAERGRPAAAGVVTTLKFVRNGSDPQNSRLYVVRGGRSVAEFRAGSGLGKAHANGRKECKRGQGWLPRGTYKVGRAQTRYNGNVIKGYAIPLSDKKCNDGRTPRTELFIHSEMTRDGGQGRTESRRWDGVGDYKSAGCIKLAPNDIKKLFRNLSRYPAPTRLTVV
ncbi:L,D-transpeptidase family protein [Streptomyces tritici]|uniref:L,D-transpeptidase family protein n=1 Tax=Streptomyces tritici TaxID=2054410 RepID=UPI003AF07416